MIAIIRHRGPDGFGFFQDERVGLAHARLSIIDLAGGQQPLANEDKSVWITFNGELFNYRALRPELEKRGHRFATNSDTEVIVHLYEDYGPECLQHLNGQFAFAIYDRKQESLLLARDRVGIRPLFYTISNGFLLFASEIKALFMERGVERALDLQALDQIFTFWTTIPPRTAFKNIHELPAGHYLQVAKGELASRRYWELPWEAEQPPRTTGDYAEELKSLLIDATRLQLRADVPVGAYLSGGLDSSTIATLIKHYSETPLRTFSLTFADPVYDESRHQQEMRAFLGANHSTIHCQPAELGRIFPEVVWHTEKPLLRTAAAPLFLLSKLVRDSGYKVVLTGEGADELLGGYDLFKEDQIRRFLEQNPHSRLRPLILKRLYPYLQHSPVRSLAYANSFFQANPAAYPRGYASHIPRWTTTARAKLFFSPEVKSFLTGYEATTELGRYLDRDLDGLGDLARAQHLEIKTLLSGYLLSSQGDRVAMAHSIEGRFPFLDHRLIEFCGRLPPTVKLHVLCEKYLLKKSMAGLLPPAIIQRSKQPYMAPDANSFFAGPPLAYIDELLSQHSLRESGYFHPQAVALLAKKCRAGGFLGFKDHMAAVGIVSTLLLHDLFINNFKNNAAATPNTKEEEENALTI